MAPDDDADDDIDAATAAPLALSGGIDRFMRYFLVHINPILHRTVYGGRTVPEHEIVVTMALRTCGALRPTDLSRGLRIDKGSLTAVLRRLRDRGLVERHPVHGDERSYEVALTAAGRRFVAHLDGQRDREIAQLFQAMDAAEIAAVVRGLDLMTAYLRRWEDTRAVRPASDGAPA